MKNFVSRVAPFVFVFGLGYAVCWIVRGYERDIPRTPRLSDVQRIEIIHPGVADESRTTVLNVQHLFDIHSPRQKNENIKSPWDGWIVHLNANGRQVTLYAVEDKIASQPK